MRSKKKARRRLVKTVMKWARTYASDMDDGIVAADEELLAAVAAFKKVHRR